MSLFEDDFYSPKVPKRHKREWLNKAKVPRRKWQRWKLPFSSSRGMTIVLVAAATAVLSSLLTLAIVLPWTESGESVQAAGDPYERIVEAADKVSPTVVSIVNKQKDASDKLATPEEAALGSGIIFKQEDGKAYVITNEHVVQGADLLEIVLANGSRKNAELVGKDKITDIAVLRMDGAGITEVAEIGDSSKLRRGETVIAIGNPLGFGDSLTAGIISYTNRKIPVSLNQDGVYDWEQLVIQTDAAINEGNSGGALVDLSGRVIGINTMKVATTGVEGLGFAIPTNEVMSIVDQIMEHGKIVRPYLGVYTIDLDNPYAPITEEQREDLELPSTVKHGVIVLEATGPAEAGGLKLNDVIVRLDDTDMTSTLDLRKYLYEEKKVGETMEVVFYRDGKRMTSSVTLTDKPES